MGAGFTISNIGPTVVDAFNAIISPPQTAILAIGAMKKRPMMVDDEIVARISAYLTLTVDATGWNSFSPDKCNIRNEPYEDLHND